MVYFLNRHRKIFAVHSAKRLSPALYDLEQDPTEENNVIDEFPEVVQQLQKILDDYRNGKGSRGNSTM